MTDLTAAFVPEKTNFQKQRDYLMSAYLCGRLMAAQTAWLILDSIQTYTNPESDDRTTALKELRDFIDWKRKATSREISIGNENKLIDSINKLMPSSDAVRAQTLISHMSMGLG